MSNVFTKMLGDKWAPIRTIWPYKDGWGVYNKYKSTLIEDGLSKEEAQKICDEMNSN